MATVKIFVKNKSDENQQFLIFNDKPAYSESVGAAWINVWGRSPGTGAKHGIADFEIRETFYAICGMSPKELSTDLTVSTSDYEAVQLGTDQVKATQVPLIVDKDGVLFDKQKIAQFKKTGSFGITSGEYDMTQYSMRVP